MAAAIAGRAPNQLFCLGLTKFLISCLRVRCERTSKEVGSARKQKESKRVEFGPLFFAPPHAHQRTEGSIYT